MRFIRVPVKLYTVLYMLKNSRILIGSYLPEGRRIDDVINIGFSFWFPYYKKQVDSILSCICRVVDH